MESSHWAFCAHCQRWFYPTSEADRPRPSCPVCLGPSADVSAEEPGLADTAAWSSREGASGESR